MAVLIWAVSTGLILSLLLEATLQPRPRFIWQRPKATLALHTGFWLLIYISLFLLCRRPWFALINTSALVLVLVLVSNAKYRALREPFIYQDFEYFTDALCHPRLYLPFLPVGWTLLAASTYLTGLAIGFRLESPYDLLLADQLVLICCGGIVVGALLLVWTGHRSPLSIACDPIEDLRHLGLFASLWCYAREESAELPPVDFPFASGGQNFSAPRQLPDLIVVQSESFFDPRAFWPGISQGILPEYDRLFALARYAGRLNVPAWGANTVRAEFAFLSAVRPSCLGIHQFNPYRRFARCELPALPRYLKGLGYRTIFIHPYPLSFYARDVVYPLLGFDEYIDILDFSSDEKSGPYIGDKAVAERILAQLSKEKGTDRQPCFIFAVTMENHGPLHLESVKPGEEDNCYLESPPQGCDDLTVYLRHLTNADKAFGMLREGLEKASRPSVLCLYGDHVPIMAEVYRRMSIPDGKSDYLVWTNACGNDLSVAGDRLERGVESLPLLLLQAAGWVWKRGAKEG